MKFRPLRIVCYSFLLAFAAAGLLPAQEGDPTAAPVEVPTETAKASKDRTVMDIWNEGGIVMYVLAAASICMVGFTVEGFMKLRPTRLAPPALIARIREAVAAGNYQEAWTICKANKCFFASVLAAGLERIGRSKDAVDFSVQENSDREAMALKTNITYLSVIGVVAPMLGLTGTVIGMIKAFSNIGASGIGDPTGLAKAIGEVLIATASGLMVAIPAFVFYYILKARAQNVVLQADSEVYKIIEDIPYDQLSGVKIGENFAADSSARSRRSTASSQKVSMSMTTNCPNCNFTVNPGVNPCPNCGAVLEWGA